MKIIRINQVKLNIHSDIDKIKLKVSKILKVRPEDITNFSLVKRTLDARDNKNLMFS